MATKIDLRNFQSIEHAVINVDGFTALVGRSNIGKSAIIRAVEAALGGNAGSNFVRHGDSCARRIKNVKTCKCVASVHIVTKDFDLLWEKGDGVNRYVYNGVVYDSVARGFPEFLRADFNPVKIGDKYTQLQVATQWEPIFLLNASGGVVADVLSDVAHLQRINVALALSEKDRREAVAGHKARLKDVGTKELELQRYVGLDVAMAQARAVEARIGGIAEKERKLQEVDMYLECLRGLATRLRALISVTEVTVPTQEPLTACSSLLQSLVLWTRNFELRSVAVDALASIEIVTVPEGQPVKLAKGKYTQAEAWQTKVQCLETNLTSWTGIGTLIVPPLPDLKLRFDNLITMAQYLKRKLTLEEQVERLIRDCALAQEEEHKSFESLRALGACPTCTRPFESGCQC